MQNRPDLPTIVFAGFSILYPLIAIAAVRTIGPGAAVAIVIALLIARLLVPILQGVPVSVSLAPLPVLIAVTIVAGFDRQLSVRLYPVFMNVAMLVAFGSTLVNPPSMAERFARAFEPDLPDSGVRYARKVTFVWAGFFAVNGTLALWSVLQPDWTAWVLYNGFIAYIAAGLLFASEYVVRRRVRRRHGQ